MIVILVVQILEFMQSLIITDTETIIGLQITTCQLFKQDINCLAVKNIFA